MKALLVVDLQYDFLPGGNLAVAKGDEIIPVINRIQDQFDLVIATQDWHPQDHKSFASQHSGKNVFDVIKLHATSQVLWPDHCIQGTKGAEFTAQWDTKKVAAIFRKGMNTEVDSYSGFYDNDHKNATGLLGYLKEKGVKALYICGLAAEFCVYYSAKDANQAGINTYFLNFATRPIREEGLVLATQQMIEKGITILNREEELR